MITKYFPKRLRYGNNGDIVKLIKKRCNDIANINPEYDRSFDPKLKELADVLSFYFDSDDSAMERVINDSCYEIAIMDPTDDESFQSKMEKLAVNLRKYFDCDYCAIGKSDGEFVEDCIVSCKTDENEHDVQERNLKSVKRVRLDKNCCVCLGLKSKDNITYFNENEIENTDHFGIYEKVLGDIRNTTIIPIRDIDNNSKGFVQIINSRYKIFYEAISSFYDSLLGLILFIHLRDGLKDANSFKKDYDFILKVQKNLDNVDSLLGAIMEYLSKEFGAGVITYRIPLLVGPENKPLFFLRDCYIRKEIAQYYSKDDYFRERLVKDQDQMGGYGNLRCKEIESVIKDKAKDIEYYSKITNKDISFRSDTLIIPVLRDYSEENECTNPQKNKAKYCDNEVNCPFRLCKYFGVFKLRILKDPKTPDNEETSEWPSEDTIKRLSNLAKHISILLNAIVEKYENKSLEIFQKELKGTSFTKIKEFDEQCTKIVNKAIHTRNCAIYRYNKNDELTFSASSEPINNDFIDIIENYCDHGDELLETLFVEKKPIYYVRKGEERLDSIMIVPMIGKENSKLGVMLLVGKEENQKKRILSKTFWEHDKKHIMFIVNVLNRIEESDSERLTFLAQLSHELLRPVTEMVYRNDYYISIAKINPEIYTKKMLVNELQNNIDMCMVFKYIIDDVEYIYSLSKGDVQYYYEMVDFRSIILDAIRLSEEEAYKSKSLEIRTFISKMPEALNIDKSRMMQVVVNLLRNAIRYSDEHQEIFVRYEYNNKKNCHEISFEDFGIPVILNDKDRIFDLYYRSKNASAKVPNGSGMGLYLVKQIMLAHGGDCYVKNDYYPTIFTIQIPNK